MNITFRKQPGLNQYGIAFFWEMQITSDDERTFQDTLIPELFFDFFCIQEGQITQRDLQGNNVNAYSNSFIKPIFTQPLLFDYHLPIRCFGARLTPRFVAGFTKNLGQPNTLSTADWFPDFSEDLKQFGIHFEHTIKAHWDDTAVAYLTPTLEETAQFKTYSPRHKRRLFKKRFGISQKEMGNIQKVHAFLAQSCDFSSDNPHIIDYLDDDHFYDQSHLNHTFKKMTGLSLLDYFDENTVLQDNLMAVSYNELAE